MVVNYTKKQILNEFFESTSKRLGFTKKKIGDSSSRSLVKSKISKLNK